MQDDAPAAKASTMTATALAAGGILGALAPEDRARLAAEFETLALKRGDTLVRQGEAADALYVVVSGRFDVRIAGQPRPVAEIGPGSPIGEIAFLAGGVRTATVTALRDSLVMRLGRADFERLCQRAPGIWGTLTATLAGRLADQTAGRFHASVPAPRTIAVIPAGPAPVPARFVALLHDAFAAAGSARLLTPRTLADAIGAAAAADVASSAATEALNALEQASDVTIYVADAELTPWSEKAIRQADLVLRVGLASPVTTTPCRRTRSSVSPPICSRPAPSASFSCTPRAWRRGGRGTGATPAPWACTTTSP